MAVRQARLQVESHVAAGRDPTALLPFYERALTTDRADRAARAGWAYAVYWMEIQDRLPAKEMRQKSRDALWLLRSAGPVAMQDAELLRIRYLLEAQNLLFWDERLLPFARAMLARDRNDSEVKLQHAGYLAMVEVQKGSRGEKLRNLDAAEKLVAEASRRDRKPYHLTRGFILWSRWRLTRDRRYGSEAITAYTKVVEGDSSDQDKEGARLAILRIKAQMSKAG